MDIDTDDDFALDFAGMLLSPTGARPAKGRPELDPAEAERLEGVRSAPYRAEASASPADRPRSASPRMLSSTGLEARHHATHEPRADEGPGRP